MPVFSIIAGNDSTQSISDFVEKAYEAHDRMSIDNGNYLIFENDLLTPQEVCTKIIGVDNRSLRLLVIPVESYWGMHDNSVWGWLKSKKL